MAIGFFNRKGEKVSSQFDNSTPMSREISAQRKENRRYTRSSRQEAYHEVKPKRTTLEAKKK